MLDQAMGWLRDQSEAMTDQLIQLANINSGSNHLTGLLQAAQWIEDWMPIPHANYQRLVLSPRQCVLDSGELDQRESGPALRWDCRPDAERRVLLAIHYDTVFGPESAFQHCQWLDQGRLQGPGVADAKGGLVVLGYALAALEKFELAENLGWTVVLNPDEELGSPSSRHLFEAVASEFDFGLLFEPALPSGELVAARKGSGNYDIVVRGKSAHAGRHFEDGRNAVAMISRVLSALDALNGSRPGVTINVGAVHGGGPVNIVPDRAVARLNVRVPDLESAHWMEQRLHWAIAQVNQQAGFQAELHGDIASPPKLENDRQRQLMRAVEAAHLAVGQQAVRWTNTGGVCDGNKLAAAGLANIDTLGPVGGGLHSQQEWVEPTSLPLKAKVIVQILHGYATGTYSL